MDESSDHEAMADASLEANLRLALISGVGPRLRQQLLDRFGSAESVLSASAHQLRQVNGVGANVCRSIRAARADIDAAEEVEICRRHGISILLQSQPNLSLFLLV